MAEELVDPKLGTVIVDRYRIEQRLGSGGMGAVYLATELATERKVAVKFLHEHFAQAADLVQRFGREVAAMGLVQHDNLVGILDSGVANGIPYLVMELLTGRPLGDLLEEGALPLPRALDLGRQLLDGVAAAHARGVVHRDLKPDNVLLVGEPGAERVKILDFGLAKLVHGSGLTDAQQLTRAGLALGTPSYMSPEQAKGAPSDHRSDLYSIGVVLYHMVTGKRVFAAESPMAILRMHMDDAPVPPSKAVPGLRISMALERVILRALEKEPAARWQSATEMIAALDATPEQRGVPVEEGDLAGDRTSRAKKAYGANSPPAPRGGGTGWVVLVVVLVLIGGGGGYAWSKMSEAERTRIRVSVASALRSARDGIRSSTTPVASTSTAPSTTTSTTPVASTSTAPSTTTSTSTSPNPRPSPGPSPGPVASDTDDDDPDDIPNNTPGAELEAADAPPPSAPPTLAAAKSALSAGKTDEAIHILYRLRKATPKSAAVALLLGHAYFARVWRTDALREYAMAIQLKGSLKRDTSLQRNVIAALDDPTYRLARKVVRKRIGTSALGELRRAGRESKNPRVKVRAIALAGELSRRRR